MGKSKDLATGASYVDTAGDNMTGNLSINAASSVSALNIGNTSSDGTIDFTKGIVFKDTFGTVADVNGDTTPWIHAGIVTTGSSGYNGNLIFATDGDGNRNANTSALTERMRIDHAGRVTMPNQPAFQADGNFGWRNYTSYTVVPTWRTTSAGQFNIGSHFNHNTGVFTCPIAGRYLINISVYTNNSGTTSHAGRIGRNGAFWGDNLIVYTNADTAYPDNSMSASYIMNASANDTIEYYHQGNIYGYHTNWSIYLLG